MLLEVCIDSVEAALAASRGGARRVELCADLLEGGVTPSAGLITAARQRIGIDLFVIVRPRGGDFCYTESEYAVMEEEIAHAKALGADGIVLGVLDEDCRVDVERTRRLVELAAPLPVTFHRAFDHAPNLEAALEDVIATGAQRVLTSGGAADAAQGVEQISRLVRQARGRISVMPGGGVRLKNIAALAATGATEFHSSMRTAYPSPVRSGNPAVAVGRLCDAGMDLESTRFTVREEDVRELAAALDGLAARQG
jgi:copper homeostasis protein